MRKSSLVLGISCVAIALSGCAGGAGGGTELPPAAFVSSTDIPSEEYIIGPLDQLTIFVWRNPELGAKVQVRPDGRITTPLIADRRSWPPISPLNSSNISIRRAFR
jgi:polysaccharide biosynthesis/export protein